MGEKEFNESVAEQTPDAQEQAPFESKLTEGRERFLAEVAAEVLRTDERTPDDFIRRFPPAVIMEGLADRPDLRAKILVPTVGLKPKTALKKSFASASEDLQITLSEGETDATEILAAFDPDDRARFLPDKILWAFIIENGFWNREKDEETFGRACSLVAYVLDRALMHGLLPLRDIVYPVVAKEVRTDLTADDLWSIIRTALDADEKFNCGHFLQAVPLRALTRRADLKELWEQIIEQKVARICGFAPEPEIRTAEDEKPEPPEEEWDAPPVDQRSFSEPPPEVTDENVRLEDGDIADVTGQPSISPVTPDVKGVFDAAPDVDEPEADRANESAAPPSADRADVVVEVEATIPPPRLLDEDGGDEETRVMIPAFDPNEVPHIPEGDFERARRAYTPEDPEPHAGSVSTNEDLVKRSLIQRLRKSGRALVGVDQAPLKDVLIQTLRELDPKTFNSPEIVSAEVHFLGNAVCQQLNRIDHDLAMAVRQDLARAKAASVVAPNPDSDARTRPARPSRAPRKKKP
jgi:hypothetical protein